MEIGRVLELYDARAKKGGSGHLLSDRLILTAAHVVGKVGDACEWRPAIPDAANPKASGWRGAVVAWVGEGIDAALLQPPQNEVFAVGTTAVALGFPSGSEAITVDAAGFPIAI